MFRFWTIEIFLDISLNHLRSEERKGQHVTEVSKSCTDLKLLSFADVRKDSQQNEIEEMTSFPQTGKFVTGFQQELLKDS